MSKTCVTCSRTWSYAEPQLGYKCRDCRIKANPLNRDSAERYLREDKTISDGLFHFHWSEHSQHVYSNCPDGCCANEQSMEEFLSRTLCPNTMEVID